MPCVTGPYGQQQAIPALSVSALTKDIIHTGAFMHKTSYRFVHLSDIHFGQEKNGTFVLHQDARDKLIDDCKAFSAANGPADGILVIGDIAYDGTQNQYEVAANWLRRVADAAGCAPFSVRTIPGNHDIDRSKINVYAKGAHDALRNATAAQVNGVLDEHLAVAEDGNALLPKVAAYREFASRFDCDFPSLKQPCWTKDYRLGLQYTIRFLGMNSVQVCDGNDNRGNMVLGNNQYIIKEDTNVVPIALIHHPLPWFKDESLAKPYLYRSPVLLFGHEHTQGFERVENHIGQVQLHIFSGAVNPPEGSQEYPFRYNWIDFCLVGDTAQRQLRVSLWPRVWSFQHTAYLPDRQSLGEKECHSFDVPCPKFTAECSTSSHTGADGSSISSDPEGKVTMEDRERDFERLKYFFWTYLDWQERLKALARLDVLPKTTTQPMPQTLEHLALQAARNKGQMKELWDMTMAFVPPEEQLPNPYNQNRESEEKHA
jgi:hypothetical protein